jgi:hypothetical protein
MRLHENKTLFRQAVQFTADQMKIPVIYVEKDYWVTYALFTIFNSAIGEEAVFKGGTALSKCYKMIERFSEDIDLVVLRREGESNNKLKSKLKTVSTVVGTVLPELFIKGITNKRGMNRKTAHSYGKEFRGSFGQIRDVIILESTWLGCSEPYTTKSIISFVGQMMKDNNQSDFATENGLLPFELLALKPTRTFCEKIMSLVRFSYSEDPIENLRFKVRHTYDLHKLLKQNELSAFFHSPTFDDMLLKVANDDVASFKNNNEWLTYHPNESLFFNDLENVWRELMPVYNGEFKNLVYGELPDEKVVFETLTEIRERLKAISWTILV